MNPLAHRPTLRRFAAWMVLAWVLSLAVSVAHACLAAPGAGVAEPLAAPMATCHEAADEDAPAFDTGLTPCVKFCDDFGSGTPTVQSAIDAGLLLAPALLPAALPPLPRSAGAAQPAATAAPPPGAGVPIPLAFLRLAR